MQNVLEKKQYQYLKMIEEKENQLKKLKQQEEIERIKKQNENKWLFTEEQHINSQVAAVEKQFQINQTAL